MQRPLDEGSGFGKVVWMFFEGFCRVLGDVWRISDVV